ncbi:MAG: DUF2851 family protein [Taibaiella sp.]|nr:DUF2851 family protein [Taibaiella sp.]
MTEALFQFIWQHSLYNVTNLSTAAGEPVVVMHPGKRNTDAGPDFLNARIRIGATILAGNIELHIKTSDWLRHGHQDNAAYHNLILHVVYDNDVDEVVPFTPVLALNNHIAADVVCRYEGLMSTPEKLPCAGAFGNVKSIVKENWLARLLAERWEQKLADWNVVLENSAEDWRNLLYWRLAANFGFKTNATPFLMLAQSLPLNILGRHRGNLMQIEALMFGQAGLLAEAYTHPYPVGLLREYNYLRQKYSLTPLPAHLWKFMRMRPPNFPTIRIAQFAALIHQSEHLFSQIIETHAVKEIEPLLDITASGYWDAHFRFEDTEQENQAPKALGKTSVHNIIINTIAPIQFLYAARQGSAGLKDQSLNLLEAVPAEKNNIINLWQATGWEALNAAQSQAQIQLYNNYCTSRRCLECTIGLNIIRSAS